MGKRMSPTLAPSWNRWKIFFCGVRPRTTSTLARPRSASMSTTCLPSCARHMARLTEMLVLPTPPLPEVTENTRGKVPLISVLRIVMAGLGRLAGKLPFENQSPDQRFGGWRKAFFEFCAV
ncbi:hypothetical protein KL86DES1_21218 [uncultured Desulfovibrio sp.]|uniref:Uncharacterized protein n=1 Tax=uncultured Desulfovibrio sp. TaxID=167968 RepID=A0A212L6Z2_9BACT|nr:hypothetical protein KL86DES1_21218 [uncultured Desulfovibrio sp.]